MEPWRRLLNPSRREYGGEKRSIQKTPVANKNATKGGEQKNAATKTMVKKLTPGGPKQALKVSDSDSARRGVHFAQKIGPGGRL